MIDDADRDALAAMAAAHREEVDRSAAVVNADILRFDGALAAQDRDRLLDAICARESEFVSNRIESRSGLVLLEPLPEAQPFVDLIERQSASIIRHFGHEDSGLIIPTLGSVLVIAYGHGDFIGPHFDNENLLDDLPAHLRARRITVDLHLHSHPKAFTGGVLRLFDHRDLGGEERTVSSFVEFEPIDNSMLIFNASTRHEVTAVRMPENRFRDRRFALTASFLAPH